MGSEEYKNLRGVALIQGIFDEFENLADIEKRGHIDWFYKPGLVLAFLLGQMGLSMSDGKIKGTLTSYIEDPKKSCHGFNMCLTTNAASIFIWIEKLEPVFLQPELQAIWRIIEYILTFMLYFNVTIPENVALFYQRFKARHAHATEAFYIQKVKDDLRDLYKHLPQYRNITPLTLKWSKPTDDFPMNIQTCVGLFWEWKNIREGNWNWMPRDVRHEDALTLIQDDVMPLLGGIDTYADTSLRGRFHALREYITHDTEKAVTRLTPQFTLQIGSHDTAKQLLLQLQALA